MLLKEKKIEWAKIDAQNPETKYQSTTEYQWSIDVILTKEEAQQWMDDGIIRKLRPAKSEDGMFVVKLKRATKWGKSGDEKTPVSVVDAYGDAIDGKIVGNGSVCNIQYNVFDTSFGGKGTELIAVQVMDLVRYEGNAGAGVNEFAFANKEVVDLEDV